MRSVDHDRADTGLYFARDIGQIFMVIEVDCKRKIPDLSQIASDRYYVTGSCIAVSSRGAGKNQGRTQLGSRLYHHLHRFQVVDIKGRNGIAEALSFQQHIFTGDNEHSYSFTFIL